MLHIGRARHPGPVVGSDPGDLRAVEFANVSGWLSNVDLAADSDALFLAVAEQRLITARARSVCHQLRQVPGGPAWCSSQLSFSGHC